MLANSKPSSSEWVGRIITGIVGVFLIADAAVALFKPSLLAAEMDATGFPPSLVATVGVITLISAVLYLIPRTAFLGAILITGFLGGAICTHFRLSEMGTPPQIICLLLGVLAWTGLYLRDARIRALLPLC